MFPHRNKSLSKELQEDLNADFKSVDKHMLIISFINFLGTVFITSYAYDTYALGIYGGGFAFILSLIAFVFYRGTLVSRILFGIIFSIYPAIMLQQQLGMIEMHFAFFYMVAFLIMYKDITPCLMFAVSAISHHLVLTYLQLNSTSVMGVPILVFGPNCSWTIVTIHIAMWLFGTIFYLYMIINNTNRFIEMKMAQTDAVNKANEINDERNYSNTVIESNTNAIIAVGKDLKVKTFNQAAQRIFGYSKEEMIGKDSLLNIVPSLNHDAHKKGIKEHFRTGVFKYHGENLELTAVRKNGETFPIRISFGEQRVVIANIQDITAEKEKEKLFLQNEKIYRDLFELNQSIILLVNPKNGNIVNVNKSAIDFYGYEKSEFLKLNATDINTFSKERMKEVIELAVKNEKNYFEFEHILANKEM